MTPGPDSLAVDADGVVWLQVQNRVYRYDGKTTSASLDVALPKKGLFQIGLTGIAAGTEGRIWVGGWDARSSGLPLKPREDAFEPRAVLYMYDGAVWNAFETIEGAPGTTAVAVLGTDRLGRIMAGTNKGPGFIVGSRFQALLPDETPWEGRGNRPSPEDIAEYERLMEKALDEMSAREYAVVERVERVEFWNGDEELVSWDMQDMDTAWLITSRGTYVFREGRFTRIRLKRRKGQRKFSIEEAGPRCCRFDGVRGVLWIGTRDSGVVALHVRSGPAGGARVGEAENGP